MAVSRNERRKLAQERLLLKSTRIAKASLAAQLDATRDRVLANTRERNYWPSSSTGRLGSSAPRFLSSGKGTGAMSSRSAQQVMTKVANKPQSRYKQPTNETDKSKWPVVSKD